MFAYTLVTLALTLSGVNAGPLDLAKIERSIRREPIYNSNSPKYCLVVFGPKAKTRVWLVVDGTTLYIDRNGNGDLTEPGERIGRHPGGNFRIANIIEKDGKTVHRNFYMRSYSNDRYLLSVTAKRLGRQIVGFAREEKTSFSQRPDTAPIVHFDGPLALAQYSTILKRSRNSTNSNYRQTWLRVMIGTPGLGKGTFAACHYRCKHKAGPLRAEFRFASATSKCDTLSKSANLATRG